MGLVFVELVGSIGAVAPWQILLKVAKVGVMEGVITMLMVVGEEHCPGRGVNVYVVVPIVEVLITVSQFPVIGGVFVEFTGKTGGVVP